MKRIVVLCDGTWNWPDQSGNVTNVVKMARAILPTDRKNVAQVVFYDQGVGTGNVLDRVAGGMLGIGLAQNVKQAYGHIVDNYEAGDQLFLLGFSRGAFTVRSLGGLIGLVGVLRKQTMDRFQRLRNSAWDFYRTPPGKRDARQAAAFIEQFGDHPPYRANIECIGVWDTVGALGIPTGPLRSIGRRLHSFHNTNLGDNVVHAFQALAIDERRQQLVPAIWKRTATAEQLAARRIDMQTLEQVWFAGAHSNVGGGYEDSGLSDIAFAWMAERVMACGLALDEAYVRRKQASASYALVDSRTLKWKLLGRSLVRQLCATDPSERVHHSALQRLDRTFPEPFAPTPYDCPNLVSLRTATGQRFEELVV